MKKRRRIENKTDYKARSILLMSDKPRIIFRKTNRYIIGQCVSSNHAIDSVVVGANSRELPDYGMPKADSIKNIPASYLTGFLLGKKISDKDIKEGILDIGLLRNVSGGKIYAFLKGVVDAGIKVNHNPKIFPNEARLLGRHLNKTVDVAKIKSAIEGKFK